jgi:hypothetical protein
MTTTLDGLGWGLATRDDPQFPNPYITADDPRALRSTRRWDRYWGKHDPVLVRENLRCPDGCHVLWGWTEVDDEGWPLDVNPWDCHIIADELRYDAATERIKP